MKDEEAAGLGMFKPDLEPDAKILDFVNRKYPQATAEKRRYYAQCLTAVKSSGEELYGPMPSPQVLEQMVPSSTIAKILGIIE